ncbi:MAG TPA: prolipoprotein diacylglyceryl transferase [Candidatus Ornithoclostridium faecavium]|nr:prolipoprotein diacylglyceryl transferase [Candidatus Ornithoclostridium faecavium]
MSDKIAFSLFNGSLTVTWYGIFVTLGILLAYFLYLFLASKRKIDIDFSLELFIWVVVLAIICCRLFYVVPRKEYYPIDSWDALMRFLGLTKDGLAGLTIVGGIFGGAMGILFCVLRYKKYSYAKVADCVVLCVFLGQIIGRWGNFANQELYGQVVTNPAFQQWPFAVFIDSDGLWHQALYIYEGFFNLIGLIIGLLLFFKYKKLKNFTISLYYVFWYGLVRGTLEFLKIEHKNFPGTEIGIVQVIAYSACIVAFVLMVLNQKGILRVQSKIYNEAGDSIRLLTEYDGKVVAGVIIEGKPYGEAYADDTLEPFRPAGELTLAERQMRAVVFGKGKAVKKSEN